MKIASREGADGGAGGANVNPAEFISELTELQRYLTEAIGGYENFYGEPFQRNEANSSSAGGITNGTGTSPKFPGASSSYSPLPKSTLTGAKPSTTTSAFHRKLVYDNVGATSNNNIGSKGRVPGQSPVTSSKK